MNEAFTLRFGCFGVGEVEVFPPVEIRQDVDVRRAVRQVKLKLIVI